MRLGILASRAARVLVTLETLFLLACSEPRSALGVMDGQAGFDAAEPDAAAPSDGPLQPDARPEGGADTGPPASGSELILDVSGGRIEGTRDGETRLFFGIPYAKPPIAELRFRPPLPADPWSGVRSAAEYGASCMQGPDMVEGPVAEDCLFVNVFAPPRQQRPAPVLVFFYGGAFVSGSGRAYDGRFLSRKENTVVVTFNHRVGALGFFTHPALDAELGFPSGNMGIRDQQLALRWVHDNIAAFGGDPTNVTLFGQSSGGLAVCYHMLAKGSEGLAQRFILESGSCAGGPMVTRDNQVQAASNEIDRQCPFAADPIACMRAIPAEKLVQKDALSAVISGGWFSYLDHHLIPDEPTTLISKGDYQHAQVLLGSTLHEFKYFNAWFPVPATRLELAIFTRLFWPKKPDLLVEHYRPDTDAEAAAAWSRQQSDGMFRCAMWQTARALAQHGDPVFLYSFDLTPAVHGLELDYVFGWPGGGLSNDYPDAPHPPLPDLVDAVQRYWSNFAAAGDPNGDGLVAWPQFNAASNQQLVLAAQVQPGASLTQDDCAVWEAYLAD